MRVLLKAILVGMVITACSFAGVFENPEIEKGRAAFYNFRFEEAVRIFNNIPETHPPLTAAKYFYLNRCYFWKFYGNRDEKSAREFLTLSEKSTKLVEKLIKSHNTTEVKFILGGLYTMRAMFYAEKLNQVDAYWASREAVSLFEEILDKNEKFYDANLGLGLFNFALSYTPSFIKVVASLTGLPTHREEGVQKVKLVYEKGDIENDEAAFYLAKMYTDYNAEYDSAETILTSLLKKYPGNLLCRYQLGIVKLLKREMEPARNNFMQVLSQGNKDFSQLVALCNYQIANSYFYENRFDKAIEYYEKYQVTTSSLDYLGITNLNLAMAYYIKGNASKFIHHITMCGTGNPDMAIDRYADEKGDYYLREKIPADELNIIKSENFVKAGMYKEAYDLLNSIKINNLLDVDKAKALSYTAEIMFIRGESNKAAEIARRVIKMEDDAEEWVITNAYITLIKIELKKGNKSKARDLTEDAMDFLPDLYADYYGAQLKNLEKKSK